MGEKLTEEEKTYIADAVQRIVSAKVLEEVARLIEEWKAEERQAKKLLLVTLGVIALGVLFITAYIVVRGNLVHFG
jgi:hypothetical protein